MKSVLGSLWSSAKQSTISFDTRSPWYSPVSCRLTTQSPLLGNEGPTSTYAALQAQSWAEAHEDAGLVDALLTVGFSVKEISMPLTSQ